MSGDPRQQLPLAVLMEQREVVGEHQELLGGEISEAALDRALDELWAKLSEGGEQVQCGWLNDKFGVSWQIVPSGLGELVAGEDPEKSQRAMKAMFGMVKLDIDALRRAYDGVAEPVS